MLSASNLKLTPFEYGEAMAKTSNPFYNPYQNKAKAREFKAGYDAQLKRTSGVPKGKEQPLP